MPFMYGGLRRGEARALRVGDVDPDAGMIMVSRHLDPVEGGQAPKTDAGIRRVPIAGALRRILAEWLVASERRGDDLLLGRTAHEPSSPRRCARGPSPPGSEPGSNR